jgi:hypothetical protein
MNDRILAFMLFAMGGVALLSLICLRVALPNSVVKTNLGFFLNLAWMGSLFLGIADWKQLPISPYRSGGCLALVSTFVGVVVADAIMGLRYFGDDLFSFGHIESLVASILLVFAWWQIISASGPSLQSRVRVIPWIIGAVVGLMILSKLVR